LKICRRHRVSFARCPRVRCVASIYVLLSRPVTRKVKVLVLRPHLNYLYCCCTLLVGVEANHVLGFVQRLGLGLGFFLEYWCGLAKLNQSINPAVGEPRGCNDHAELAPSDSRMGILKCVRRLHLSCDPYCIVYRAYTSLLLFLLRQKAGPGMNEPLGTITIFMRRARLIFQVYPLA